jgi:hypothetical protein
VEMKTDMRFKEEWRRPNSVCNYPCFVDAVPEWISKERDGTEAPSEKIGQVDANHSINVCFRAILSLLIPS